MQRDHFADVDPDAIPAAADELFEVARQQFLRPPVQHERRRHPRYYIAAEAVARPLNDDGSPAGPPFRGVVADLSNGGLRMLHPLPVTAPRLAVRLNLWDDTLDVVLRVLRRNVHQTHCETAGEFLTPIQVGEIDGSTRA